MTSAITGAAYMEIINAVVGMGLPGLMAVLMWLSMRQNEKTKAEQREEFHAMQAQYHAMLEQYREDVKRVIEYYERNVELVKRYEKLSDELSDIIHLNTQVQTRLVEKIDSNMFCPIIRENGAKNHMPITA